MKDWNSRDAERFAPVALTPETETRLHGSRKPLLALLTASLWILWQVIRLPLLTLLVILEPLIRFVLSTAALLILLTAIFWVLFDPHPDFPLGTFIAFSLGCVALLALYHALIRLFSMAA